MKLISDKMCKALDDLTAFCFLGNRIFDRAHSVLDVNFVMPNTAEVVHLNMAHQFPLLADLITDYLSVSASCVLKASVFSAALSCVI